MTAKTFPVRDAKSGAIVGTMTRAEAKALLSATVRHEAEDARIDAQIDRVRELRVQAFTAQLGTDESRIDAAFAFLRTLDHEDVLLLAAEDIMRRNDMLRDALDRDDSPDD